MRHATAIILLAATVWLGCRDTKILEGGVAAPFSALGQPWSELTNVTFGMKNSSLLANRPAAKMTEYDGVVEVIREDTVYFRTGAHGWLHSDRLQEVAISRDYATDSAARAAWDRRVGEITASLGAPDACLTITHPVITSENAIWLQNDVTVRLSVSTGWDTLSGGPLTNYVPRVLTTVASGNQEPEGQSKVMSDACARAEQHRAPA